MIRSRILLVCSILWVAGCNQSPSLSTVQVQPSSAALTFDGQTVQFQAIGTYQRVGHPSNSQDISGSVTWTSSNPGAATISATGMATAVGNGSTMITATTSSYGGAVIGTAALSVSGETTHDLTSITIVPGGQPTTEVGEPAQFLAFGNYNTPPFTAEITNSVRWVSSDVSVATVNSTGLSLDKQPGYDHNHGDRKVEQRGRYFGLVGSYGCWRSSDRGRSNPLAGCLRSRARDRNGDEFARIDRLHFRRRLHGRIRSRDCRHVDRGSSAGVEFRRMVCQLRCYFN